MWRQALIPANHKALNRITEKKPKLSFLKHDQNKLRLDNPSSLLTDILKTTTTLPVSKIISQAPHSAALELLSRFSSFSLGGSTPSTYLV